MVEKGTPTFRHTLVFWLQCAGISSGSIVINGGKTMSCLPSMTGNGNHTTYKKNGDLEDCLLLSGWWFRTFSIFPYIGNFIIRTDFHIFQRF